MKGISWLLPLFFIAVISCRSKDQQHPDRIPAVNADSLPVNDTLTAMLPADSIKKSATPELPDDPYAFVDILSLDSSVLTDMRYATVNNFLEEKIYECGRCFLRKAVAEAVLAVHDDLRQKGMGLKFFDCYRPRPFQQKLWDKNPDPRYVTNPAKGSMHNRGAAVDLTIVDSEGKELDMGTGFDYFGPKAYHTTTDLPEEVLINRSLLKTSMEAAGFKSIRTEWWHYSYIKMKGFELSDYLWDCDTYENNN